MSDLAGGAYSDHSIESGAIGLVEAPSARGRLPALDRLAVLRIALVLAGIAGAVMVVADRAGWMSAPSHGTQQAEVDSWDGQGTDAAGEFSAIGDNVDEAGSIGGILKPPQATPTPIVHVVAAGESLLEIAANYGVHADIIARANDLWDPNRLRVGQTITIPVPGYLAAATKADESGEIRFWWPLQGEITTYFGEKERYYIGGAHTGLDIAANIGVPVRAAAPGKVVQAWKRPDNVGWHLVIDHGNGWSTLYGHLSKFLVDEGDKVERGQVIGAAGDTGFSFGPHLHFEIRRWGVPLDPLKYLP